MRTADDAALDTPALETPALAALSTSGIAADAVFLLEKLGAVGTMDANRRLKAFGLNARSFSVLSLAGESRDGESDAGDTDPPTQKALAEMLTLDPSQIVSLVDRLERDGLVERVPDARDRRIRRVAATDQGRQVCAAARRGVAEAQAETLGELSTGEVDQLVALLRRAIFGESAAG